MKNSFTLILVFLFLGFTLSAQSTLEGTIKDKETGNPLDFAYIKLYKGNNLITGTQSDLDGNYLISNIDPGTYDIEASYLGYQSERKRGVILKAGKITRVNFELGVAGEMLDSIVISDYRVPLIEIDNTTSGGTVTAEKIQNLPTKSVTAIASNTAGVTSIDGGSINIRGSRSNGTAVYVDGIKVSSINAIPQSEIEQMQVITGGLAAKYGDATGGLISLTTKGPSPRLSGGLELETSEYLDPYGYNLASAYLSGPIWKINNRPVLGFRFSGQYKNVKDDSPNALGYYILPEEKIAELEEEPVVKYKNVKVPKGIFLRSEDISEPVKAAPNEEDIRLDLNGKIDARISDKLDIAISGGYTGNKYRFSPSINYNPSAMWRLANWQNNPYGYFSRYRGNFKLRHRIGKQGIEVEEGKASGSLLRNLYYVLRVGYEKRLSSSEDLRHKDNYFNYGYYGSMDMELIESIEPIDTATWHGRGRQPVNGVWKDFVGYLMKFDEFVPNDEINPVLAKFNDLNGYENNNYSILWDDLFYNVGKVYNRVSKSDNETYSANLSIGFDFLPGGSKKGRHNIELGGAYEMRIYRSWSIAPLSLWELMREQQNSWINGLDTTDIVGTFTKDGYEWLRYNTKLNVDEHSKFYKSIRELISKTTGKERTLHDFVNVDGDVTPDQLSLDLFSAKELNDKRLLSYYGYDYLGNKLGVDVKFNDFFTPKGKEGFWSPAYNPIYAGAYIQDKFSFKDIIMRVGVRMDYFDANTKVMKDPYSLYEIMDAKEFFETHPEQNKPASVGDDYKVYVAGEESDKVIGYRRGDQWYQPNGTATSGGLIFKGGLVYPYYKERDKEKRNIQSDKFDPNISFEDYTPQYNFMPRIAFSFPISEDAGFFAHYDVLVQRPSASNVLMTPIRYYYFESTNNAFYNNSNLKPEKTIDYEVGFQQKLTNNSALKIQAFYREQRDMIRVRPFLYVPSISQYKSYGNLDYGTVKGFSFTYDFRRKGNLEFQVAYTLQFAFGTGSSANSAFNISNRDIIRNLYPLDFDERHRLTATIDYRYFSGKLYNGPEVFGYRILENAGVNIQMVASSGRPYTRSAQPAPFGGFGYVGSINGARKPWYFDLSMKVDKSFKISKLRVNAYLRVENLLDTRNVIGVYSYSGDPDDDGYLLSPLGQNRIQAIINQGLPVENFYDMYDWRLNSNNHYSRPRRIYFGLMFNL